MERTDRNPFFCKNEASKEPGASEWKCSDASTKHGSRRAVNHLKERHLVEMAPKKDRKDEEEEEDSSDDEDMPELEGGDETAKGKQNRRGERPARLSGAAS